MHEQKVETKFKAIENEKNFDPEIKSVMIFKGLLLRQIK